jgi:hypothetical protein
MTQPDDDDIARQRIAAFTPDQVMAGIAAAIQARDWEAVEGLLKILAVKDPFQAQLVYDMLIFAAADDPQEAPE